MLGLLLLYFIGKAYYDLAADFDRNKWGYAISGVAVYYLGTFIAGIMIGLYYEVILEQSIDDMNDYLLGLMALPFGLLSCWIVYKVLERRWEYVELKANDSDILDDEFL